MTEPKETVHNRAKLIKRWGGLIAGIVGIVGLSWYISSYSAEFYRLEDLSVDRLVLLFLIVLLGHVLIALKLKLNTTIFGVQHSLWESFLLVEAGSFVNLVPLNAGSGLRAIYLKKVRGLKYVDFSLGFVSSLFSNFTSAGLLGLLFLLWLPEASSALYLAFTLYLLGSLSLLAIVWLLRRLPKVQSVYRGMGQSRFSQFLHSLVRGMDIIATQPHMLLYWVILDLLANITLGLRFWLVGQFLGYATSFAAGMVLQSVSRISAIVTIVPSGTVGLREALTGFGATGLGEAAIQGVLIATVDRIIVTGVIVVLGSMSFFLLKNRIAEAEERRQSIKNEQSSTHIVA